MNRSEALLGTFAALYGGFTPKEIKRSRKFACTLCGKAIPPGKPGRRCKECRGKELAIIYEADYEGTEKRIFAAFDESTPLKNFSGCQTGRFPGIPSEWARHRHVQHIPAPKPVDGEEPKDPFAIVREKTMQMGFTNAITCQIIEANTIIDKLEKT